MPASPFPEDTSFTLDILGRYTANSLDEALDSSVPGRKYAEALHRSEGGGVGCQCAFAASLGHPAWVAVATGFEVQIDEQGRPNYFDRHRTGALYDVPAGQVSNGVAEPAHQQFTAGPVLTPRHWYDLEIEVTGDLYVTRIRDAQAAGTTFQQIARFPKPAGQYQNRGLPASVDPRSGYVGIQAHSGAVAFRQIRVKG